MNLTEDPISEFFHLSDCPKVLNLPSDVTDSGEVIREQANFSIEKFSISMTTMTSSSKSYSMVYSINMVGYSHIKESCAGFQNILNSIATHMTR